MPWVKEKIVELRADIKRHKNVPGYEMVTRDMRLELAEMRRMTWRQQNYKYEYRQMWALWENDPSTRPPTREARRQILQAIEEKWQPEEETPIEEEMDIDVYLDRLEAEEKARHVKFLPVAKGPPIDPILPWPKPKKPRKRRPHKLLFPTGTETEKRKALRAFIKKRRPDWKGIKVYAHCITIDGRGSVYFHWLNSFNVPATASIWDHITRQNLEYAINRFDNMSAKPAPAFGTGSSG
jgi:hypothetical protein